jgi:hypothetical protein
MEWRRWLPAGSPLKKGSEELVSRKGAKARRENDLSFRTKREIFPRSLAFARDDSPWACHLASWRLGAMNFLAVVLFKKARI